MELFNIIAILLSLSAIFSYINYRYLRLPTTIGVMLISIVMSLFLVTGDAMGMGIKEQAKNIVDSIDFDVTLLHGMLSFLLFAGALHVKLENLVEQKWIIGLTATIGVILSTFFIGTVMYFILQAMNMPLTYAYCLVFGALISPTDPIAVLAILKEAKVPKSIETKITGESLFNDGVAVVVFLVIAGVATGEQQATFLGITTLFVEEALGGVVMGLVLGYAAYYMLKSIDNYQTEILISLAVVSGGYSLAMALHVSGPIAIVVAGLMIGNKGRILAMSETTSDHLDSFWELIDEILNAVLFVLIGLQILSLDFSTAYILEGCIAIPIVLMSRFITVSIPVMILQRYREFSPGVIKMMTWGGLRGGISVALALSLPQQNGITVMTYIVVLFSIVVQGLTVKKLIVSIQNQQQN
ncbi:cation:proton antiporter [Candidatus Uabimicrobium amorphum]|uniref:Sodium:proton antiporter n=1 Tax=Uabimicrobium amorphum TaxID=2596890 RepID=A0A5S9F2X4_UABAM|nr:sodium:proton antiporter [Candidatus Uabimicrobium amorphum]BBM83553.1 sodium:proton antiporter [Candidatus Uabimicrobium amorphum]